MKLTETKKFKVSFFKIQKNNDGYYGIKKGRFCQLNESFGNIQTFRIYQPSKFCCLDNADKFAVINTIGELYIVDIKNGALKNINLPECSEGVNPIYISGEVWWANWDGMIFSYNISDNSLKIVHKFDDKSYMPLKLMPCINSNSVVIQVLDRNQKQTVFYCADISSKKIAKIDCDDTEDDLCCCISNDSYFYIYSNENSSIKKYQFINNRLELQDNISIMDNSKSYYSTIESESGLMIISDLERIIVIDENEGRIIFDRGYEHIYDFYIYGDEFGIISNTFEGNCCLEIFNVSFE